ncbi:MAG: 4-(cytidine 5'-diphospho)-2-C-methyl-D-erythritol kinase [Bacteroidales bacterium]|nr:4-(cytidine 5'-diphospho)-2-C-methyl-D-erythritol kinase [Bacteroidales bacterium]MBN2819209.1 4-(cytidine 5'-diphospho)-2-C-methyl-D-erythritol kinase [Bacteroidales bacterium]
MILFPNAKINLGLNVLSRRDDGFHNIESCFLPVKISDVLEFVETNQETSFYSSGISIPGESSENLCVKAWELLYKECKIPRVKIHLHKIIPIGAGLGGGSSDAAFMLKGLNEYFKLGLPDKKLESLAAQLGSDCAFFIRNKPTLATGRGEILESLSLNLDAFKIVLVNPGIHVSTAEAYSGLTPCIPGKRISDILNLPISKWQELLVNDFEKTVTVKHPKIKLIKEVLLKLGAVYSAMTGSGSTVFGIFEKVPENLESAFKDTFVWVQK